MNRQAGRGFTLVEVLVAMAIALLLAGVVLPSMTSHAQQARRADAVAVLTKLEFAQASYHAHHGRYTTNLAALGLRTGASDQGHYRLVVEDGGPERYRARAEAVPGGVQRDDRDCPELTLDVSPVEARRGPTLGCWGR